jgi:hypothetical protein
MAKINIKPLLYWVSERQSIARKKAAGEPAPWTKDPILQTYRFCNVRRQADRVSQWMLYNVLQHQAGFDDQLVFLKWVSLCRWVNWPPTLGLLLDPEFIVDAVTYNSINLPAIGAALDLRCTTDKVWTGAYMIRAPSRKKYGKIGKGKFVAEIVVGEGLDQHGATILTALQTKSVRATWEAFCAIPNWGSFMAGQVVADLTYTPLLSDAIDLYTWAPMGPGSRRGYNRLIGLPLKHKPPAEEIWCLQLAEWRALIVKELGQEYDDLTLHDIQNALCETDKYIRTKRGEGRPRSKYKPETAYEPG